MPRGRSSPPQPRSTRSRARVLSGVSRIPSCGGLEPRKAHGPFWPRREGVRGRIRAAIRFEGTVARNILRLQPYAGQTSRARRSPQSGGRRCRAAASGVNTTVVPIVGSRGGTQKGMTPVGAIPVRSRSCETRWRVRHGQDAMPVPQPKGRSSRPGGSAPVRPDNRRTVHRLPAGCRAGSSSKAARDWEWRPRS